MAVITFIGAGSVVFTQDLLTDLAQWDGRFPMTWRLHDIDEARLATAAGVARRLVAERGLRAVVEVHPQRRTALPGCDVIVVSAMVGGITATRADLLLPAEHGLHQTIGDTLGVGGIFRGLRSVPFYRALLTDVQELCPEAWLLNYTNPMAINMQVVHALAPEVRALGLCHSVHWTVHDLCELLGVPMAEVDFLAAGVNHQSWLLRLQRHGRDLYPALDALIDADPQLRRRVRVDMYRRLGRYPTESSEHSAEYVPWYLRHEGERERLRLQSAEYVQISEDNAAQYEATAAAVADQGPLTFATEAVEYAPQVVAALFGGEPAEVYATVPNTGLVDGLPVGAPVEVPVRVDADGAHPVAVGALPPVCAALGRRMLDVVDHAARAGVTEDPELVRHAALLDPNTAASLTPAQVDAVLDRLTEAHRELLPAGLARARYALT